MHFCVSAGKAQVPASLGPIPRSSSGDNMLRSFSRDSITRMCSSLPKLNLSNNSNSTGHPSGPPPAWMSSVAPAGGAGAGTAGTPSSWYTTTTTGAAGGGGGPGYPVDGFELAATEGFKESPGTRQLCGTCRERAQGSASHLCDPEHLIVNGSGGAFMHPTHVFSYSRFACLKDEAAEATAAMYSSTKQCCNR